MISVILQVLGHKEGLNVMERADPLFLLIGLPTIPVMLILGKMVRWEDYLLRLWRKHSSKLPLLNYLFPDGNTRMSVCFCLRYTIWIHFHGVQSIIYVTANPGITGLNPSSAT